jgi:hypothetical protein
MSEIGRVQRSRILPVTTSRLPKRKSYDRTCEGESNQKKMRVMSPEMSTSMFCGEKDRNLPQSESNSIHGSTQINTDTYPIDEPNNSPLIAMRNGQRTQSIIEDKLLLPLDV